MNIRLPFASISRFGTRVLTCQRVGFVLRGSRDKASMVSWGFSLGERSKCAGYWDRPIGLDVSAVLVVPRVAVFGGAVDLFNHVVLESLKPLGHWVLSISCE